MVSTLLRVRCHAGSQERLLSRRITIRGRPTGARQRSSGTCRQHDAGSLEPGRPSQLSRRHPERKRIIRLEKAAERLERRRRLQIDRDLLGISSWRAAVNDLDIEPWQARSRPGGVELAWL